MIDSSVLFLQMSKLVKLVLESSNYGETPLAFTKETMTHAAEALSNLAELGKGHGIYVGDAVVKSINKYRSRRKLDQVSFSGPVSKFQEWVEGQAKSIFGSPPPMVLVLDFCSEAFELIAELVKVPMDRASFEEELGDVLYLLYRIKALSSR